MQREAKVASLTRPDHALHRHMCFDGRMLHAAPLELADPRHTVTERFTFLVNVWVGHKVSRTQLVNILHVVTRSCTCSYAELRGVTRSYS